MKRSPWLTLKQAADRSGIGSTSLHKFVVAQKLPARWIFSGKRRQPGIHVHEDDLRKFVKQRQQNPRVRLAQKKGTK